MHPAGHSLVCSCIFALLLFDCVAFVGTAFYVCGEGDDLGVLTPEGLEHTEKWNTLVKQLESMMIIIGLLMNDNITCHRQPSSSQCVAHVALSMMSIITCVADRMISNCTVWTESICLLFEFWLEALSTPPHPVRVTMCSPLFRMHELAVSRSQALSWAGF
jgi:hypothetical protein